MREGTLGRAPAPEPDLRVSTFELFFDLVFVFTLTQLTTLVHDAPTFTGLARAALVLAVIWWMYGGYAWLTNAVPPRHVVDRVLVFVGMAGGFVAALAIPDAFARAASPSASATSSWCSSTPSCSPAPTTPAPAAASARSHR